MRKAFIRSLTDIIKKNSRVILLTGDLGFTVFEDLRERYPKQFLNAGVAEQNMISIAAGLSLSGRIPVCYSIASFITAKTYEQIKIDLASHRLPSVIVGTGAGLSYSTASITHHSLDDIALMRLIPDMRIYSPADNQEVALCLSDAIHKKFPSYIRLTKQEEEDVHFPKKLQSAFIVKKGSGVALLGTGAGVNIAIKTAQLLKDIKPTIVSIPVLKPFDHTILNILSKQHWLFATVEEHGTIGGLGSIVSEMLVNIPDKKPLVFGTPDEFLWKIGTLETLRKYAGLDPSAISKKILKEFNTKNHQP